jgi:hypothetical protein
MWFSAFLLHFLILHFALTPDLFPRMKIGTSCAGSHSSSVAQELPDLVELALQVLICDWRFSIAGQQD